MTSKTNNKYKIHHKIIKTSDFIRLFMSKLKEVSYLYGHISVNFKR